MRAISDLISQFLIFPIGSLTPRFDFLDSFLVLTSLNESTPTRITFHKTELISKIFILKPLSSDSFRESIIRINFDSNLGMLVIGNGEETMIIQNLNPYIIFGLKQYHVTFSKKGDFAGTILNIEKSFGQRQYKITTLSPERMNLEYSITSLRKFWPTSSRTWRMETLTPTPSNKTDVWRNILPYWVKVGLLTAVDRGVLSF